MPTWSIPGTATVGQAGHTSDHNLITSALDQIVELLPSVYNVVYYGADPTGVADSSSAFAAVQTAIGTNPATVYIPTGTYKTSTFLTLKQNQNIQGDGSAAVTINYNGSTTALTIGPTGAFNDAQNAGTVKGFSLVAYGASGTPNGIQFGNLQALHIDDVQLFGFAGIGLRGLNSGGGWAEENNIRMSMIQCGTACVLDSSSYDYSNLDFLIVTGPAQGGFYIQNGAQCQGCQIRIRGNFYVASSNTAAVIAVEPTNTSGAAYFNNCLFDVAVENAPASGATVGYQSHYTIYMGSSNAASQFVNCTGVLSFSNVATTTSSSIINFRGVSNNNFVPFGFSGVINDTKLGIMQAGDGLAILGGTDYVVQGGTSGGLFANTVFFQFGDIQPFQLAPGNNHLVFDGVSSGTGGFAKRVTLLIKQSSSGGSTITWPSNVFFPTAPTFSIVTTANSITQFDMIYIPADNIWYATVAGTNYV